MADIKAAVSSTLRGRGAPAGSCGVLLLEDAAEHAGGQYIWQQVSSLLSVLRVGKRYFSLWWSS